MLSYEALYHDHLLPHLEQLTSKVYTQKDTLKICETNAFNPKAQFLEGKILNGFSYCLVHSSNAACFQSMSKDLLTYLSHATYETWGILNALFGLLRLHQHNLLDTYLSESLRSTFSNKLHYRTFLNENDLTLINKPTNYYGVAFGIASIRLLLGFDTTNDADAIFDKLMQHIEVHSNGSDYMDETNGDGRFDRYTLLIPAELINLCILCNRPIPEKLIAMLKKSCSIYLALANANGDGFAYGRSIGAYGDTSALEILSLGCYLDLFSTREKQIAYQYCLHIANKFQTTWYNPHIQSINMWFDGRRTDTYRNINRILGENYSLYLQILHSFEYLGRSSIHPPLSTFTPPSLETCEYVFNEGLYQQKLYLFRILGRTCMLPFINGAHKYYNATPYLPTPHLQGCFESAPDTYHPNLIPCFTLKDGRKLMPICYFKTITHRQQEDTLTITATLDTLCELGSTTPQPSVGTSGTITYTITPKTLKATFAFTIPNLQTISLEYASFANITAPQNNTVFIHGPYLERITLQGFDTVTSHTLPLCNTDYHTPNGPLQSLIKASTNHVYTQPVGYTITFSEPT